MTSRPSLNRLLITTLILLVVTSSLAAASGPQPSRERSRSGAKTATADQTDLGSAGERGNRKPGTKDGSAASQLDLPKPNPTQQANLQQLKNDLTAISQGVKGAETEVRQLAQDLQGMALQPPDPALVQDLASSLSAAMDDSTLSPQEMVQLTQAVYGVLNSAGLSQQEIEVLKNDVEAVLTASGVGKAEVQAVVNDLQAIYDASQGNSSKTAGRRFSRGQ